MEPADNTKPKEHPTVVDNISKRTFFNKYKAMKKLGEGSFGKIYSAVNINTNQNFALKMEYKDANQNLLEAEAYILCYLKGYGVPAVKSYGFSGEFNILVMELLGKSLEEIFQTQNKKYSVKTVCMIGIQMIDRLEFIHNKNILHRDIKPDNFVMGLDDKSHIVYVLDFGLSKKYRSTRTHQHIKFVVNKKLTGTARYASINALKGCEQSRRDDLEAIGYVLLYFLRGSLPWQGLKVNRGEDRYKKIYVKKKGTTPEELCKGFPDEFVEYIKYTRNLEFEADPDYRFLRGLFVSVLTKQKLSFDFCYDWTKEKPNIKDQISIERYMKNNTNISLELKNSKDDKDSEFCLDPKNNPLESNLNTDTSSKPGNHSNNNIISNENSGENIQNNKNYSDEVVKTNVAAIDVPVNNDNNEKESNKERKTQNSANKKDNKKDKQDKNKKTGCHIF